MTVGLLLWPHANGRYFEAVMPLARAELTVLARAIGLAVEPRVEAVAGVPFLLIEADKVTDSLIGVLSRHSMAYLIGAFDGGAITPLSGRADAYLDHDLSGILKYKGKTNEAFTRFLINMALAASDFAPRMTGRLTVFDPMCGKLTTLFEAVNRGYDAIGADVDRKALQEGFSYFKKYLEYHRLKHSVRERSLSLPQGKAVRAREVAFAKDAASFKRGETHTLSILDADAERAAAALPKGVAHIAALDLPYGVQHGPSGAFDAMLTGALTGIHRALKPGGAVALSFNTYTLKPDAVRDRLRHAGFEVCTGPEFEGLSHFVEQAIVRDVVVARRS